MSVEENERLARDAGTQVARALHDLLPLLQTSFEHGDPSLTCKITLKEQTEKEPAHYEIVFTPKIPMPAYRRRLGRGHDKQLKLWDAPPEAGPPDPLPGPHRITPQEAALHPDDPAMQAAAGLPMPASTPNTNPTSSFPGQRRRLADESGVT